MPLTNIPEIFCNLRHKIYGFVQFKINLVIEIVNLKNILKYFLYPGCWYLQRELGVSWDVELYGELLKIGGGKERLINSSLFSLI